MFSHDCPVSVSPEDEKISKMKNVLKYKESIFNIKGAWQVDVRTPHSCSQSKCDGILRDCSGCIQVSI